MAIRRTKSKGSRTRETATVRCCRRDAGRRPRQDPPAPPTGPESPETNPPLDTCPNRCVHGRDIPENDAFSAPPKLPEPVHRSREHCESCPRREVVRPPHGPDWPRDTDRRIDAPPVPHDDDQRPTDVRKYLAPPHSGARRPKRNPPSRAVASIATPTIVEPGAPVDQRTRSRTSAPPTDGGPWVRRTILIEQALLGHARVHLGGGDRGVPQHLLNDAQIGPMIEHVGGARMSQHVR